MGERKHPTLDMFFVLWGKFLKGWRFALTLQESFSGRPKTSFSTNIFRENGGGGSKKIRAPGEETLVCK